MLKDKIRQTLVMLVAFTLAFSPMLRAAQLSLPSGDLVAPQITQEKYVDKVAKNSDHKIQVKVRDNVGVKQVILYYRVIGTENYKTRTMQNAQGSDDYTAVISASEIRPPGIEYYIQAMDFAGNTLLHGYSFSPLSVKTVGADDVELATAGSGSAEKTTEESLFSNKWVWVGLGVLLLGAAAGGGGGGGGDEPTATLTINTAEPVQ